MLGQQGSTANSTHQSPGSLVYPLRRLPSSKTFDQQVPRISINTKSVGPHRELEMKNFASCDLVPGKA
ncbi:hypothetical protein ACN38_g4122 [Penicillium nordicum]|uniref:Uncharacterized protein n=1 Tax=Penicillium nordicum TaxID=229535 RepID=A0A0M8P776_9EURO|nr:hypothetical protein ACN38_g4122 [Penicillium nordicum]